MWGYRCEYVVIDAVFRADIDDKHVRIAPKLSIRNSYAAICSG